jgi:UDP-glucuronate 4-epimerase
MQESDWAVGMRVEAVQPRRILVTGAAGFIGFHMCRRFLDRGDTVFGIDNLNDYYEPALKEARLSRLVHERFRVEIADLTDHDRLRGVFGAFLPTHVVHLAAQAGVRYSLENPRAYIASNIDGFLGILEACRHTPVSHLLYASSSSVYGADAKPPFSEAERADRPISLYAATKRANELMAYTYAHLYGIAATGLRFFTVYGPWGRPDMAYYGFTKAILEGRAIQVFNDGQMWRDFTYIDDVVEGLARLLDRPPDAAKEAPHTVYNIGNHTPVELERFISILGDVIGRPVLKAYRPMQPGDVPTTCADVDALYRAVGFAPSTTLEDGLRRFVAWYREHHGHLDR